jgi:DNA-binding response OmpR family regulator
LSVLFITLDVLDDEVRLEELRARLEQLAPMLRVRLITAAPASAANRMIQVGALTMRPAEQLVSVAGRQVELRRREYQLLELLASHPNRVFRREELLLLLWGPEFSGSRRTVDTHVRRLRDRLGEFGRERLQTVRRVGYRLQGCAAPGA